jgi:hypothetical protein
MCTLLNLDGAGMLFARNVSNVETLFLLHKMDFLFEKLAGLSCCQKIVSDHSFDSESQVRNDRSLRSYELLSPPS